MQTQLRHHGRTLALVALALLVALVTAISVAGGAGASSPASTSGGGSGGPAWIPVQSEGQDGQRERAPEGDRDCPEGERGGQGSGAQQDQSTGTPEV